LWRWERKVWVESSTGNQEGILRPTDDLAYGQGDLVVQRRANGKTSIIKTGSIKVSRYTKPDRDCVGTEERGKREKNAKDYA